MTHQDSSRPLGRWVAEVVLILVSVAVGFAAAQYGQARQDRALREAVLRGLLEEARSNIATLDTIHLRHKAWQQALEHVAPSNLRPTAIETMLAARPGMTGIGVPLKRAAWSTAVSSGALRLIDYDIVAALSEIYDYQDHMTENHGRYISNAMYSTAAFDPGSRTAAIRQIAGVFGEISGNEVWLLGLYRTNLPAIERAAESGR